MFINTLGIRKGVVDIAMQNRMEENISAVDHRGKGAKKATPPETLQGVRNHIERFPVMASHYCREKTQRKYLPSDFNITIMYTMYKEDCTEKNLAYVSSSMYRKIFCEEYNLDFYRPRKDQCRLCMCYNIPSSIKTETIEADHHAHLAAKDRARQEKRVDKKLAETSNRNTLCCNFDLPQVLMVPNDPTNNALFYKQRLKSFNFTIYNVVSKQGDCYMWSEVEGKREAVK
ncbi:dna-directed rna polymerases i ii and iii subunit rpabc2 [Holotrichia oblita]|uniref:Dna-directed rna polymerases i ii and iii subunit rpabc2 n=1 Tax=Holotrichia oblita TaxID=644536 RepID=A0ACB9T8S7_HOLOL|nr:dna-directed rna polymerases i ii and iii subunit rpabc2 [Holotrichia oblita]